MTQVAQLIKNAVVRKSRFVGDHTIYPAAILCAGEKLVAFAWGWGVITGAIENHAKHVLLHDLARR